MRTAQPKPTAQARSHRPRAITVFAAAFVAGAAAAVGVNRALDVRLAQSKPRVESEAIFVALRSLPQGAPVTVWDVALRDWPKAMMPASALRASDAFSGHILKHPLREGQPLLAIQLAPASQGVQPAADPTAAAPPASFTHVSVPTATSESDLWSPAEPVRPTPHVPLQQPAPPIAPPQEQLTSTVPAPVEPAATVATADAAAMTATTESSEPAVESASPDSGSTSSTSTPADDGVAAAAEAAVTDSASVAVEVAADPASAPAAVPEPPAATPEPTATTAVAAPPMPVATSDTPEPVVATPTAPMAPVATAPAAPAAPVDPAASAVLAAPAAPATSPRPTYPRFLVVPESIAVQADASFTSRPTPEQPPATTPTTTGQQAASRSGSNGVRPLPSTTTAERGNGGRSQQGPQGRTPQRQGRQAQPASPTTPTNTPPQPRLGSTMFPNLSAGIDAIEGRIRRDQPAQGQAPNAAQPRPLTAR